MAALVRLDSLSPYRACCRRLAVVGIAVGLVGLAVSLRLGFEPVAVVLAWLPATALSAAWLVGRPGARPWLGHWAWGFAAVNGFALAERFQDEPPLRDGGSVWIELGALLLVFLVWRGLGRHRHPEWHP